MRWQALPLIGFLVVTPADGYSQSPAPSKKPLTVEQLQRLKALDEIKDALEELGAMGDSMGRKKETACLLAFGDEGFCGCLRENLPVITSFELYVQIVTSSKENLGYAKLSADEKVMVDNTIKARESCVLQARRARSK